MSWSYTDLLALQQDDWALENMQLRFVDYQQIWRSQGVLALVHRLLQDFSLVQKLATAPDAEDPGTTAVGPDLRTGAAGPPPAAPRQKV